MTTLYDELRLLFAHNPRLLPVIELSSITTPETLARAMCDFATKETPQTNCDFWNRFLGLDVWEIAYFGTDAQKWAAADWLRGERVRRQEIAAANDSANWQPE